MRIYLAGPMSIVGPPDYNYPAFTAATRHLRSLGFEVLSPAENFDGATDRPYVDYIRADIPLILQAEALVLLPGWEDSRGVRMELTVARSLDLPVLQYDGDATSDDGGGVLVPLLAGGSPLDEAWSLVHGKRGTDYGHPIEDFTRTGRMWGAILGIPDVSAERVALCMVALKISRECHRPKRDNLTDMAGYVETLDMVKRKRATK